MLNELFKFINALTGCVHNIVILFIKILIIKIILHHLISTTNPIAAIIKPKLNWTLQAAVQRDVAHFMHSNKKSLDDEVHLHFCVLLTYNLMFHHQVDSIEWWRDER